jgi:hypothetical protein
MTNMFIVTREDTECLYMILQALTFFSVSDVQNVCLQLQCTFLPISQQCVMRQKTAPVIDVCGHTDNATKFLTCPTYTHSQKLSWKARGLGSGDHNGQFYISEGRGVQLTTGSI